MGRGGGGVTGGDGHAQAREEASKKRVEGETSREDAVDELQAGHLPGIDGGDISHLRTHLSFMAC